jgi:chorismate-pyruvate lyase
MNASTRARLQELEQEWRQEATRLEQANDRQPLGRLMNAQPLMVYAEKVAWRIEQLRRCADALAACLAAEGEAEPHD